MVICCSGSTKAINHLSCYVLFSYTAELLGALAFQEFLLSMLDAKGYAIMAKDGEVLNRRYSLKRCLKNVKIRIPTQVLTKNPIMSDLFIR